MKMKKTNISHIVIIGFGQFGQTIHKILSSTHAQVTVLTKKDPDWSVIHTADLIIPCVPINQFEPVIKKIATHQPQGIVMDVCSVKTLPVEIMRDDLPETCRVIATHPLFGPDTLQQPNPNLRMMVHRVRVDQTGWKHFCSFWRNIGISLIEMKPTTHDKHMAHTQAVAFLIGHIADQMLIDSPLKTLTCRLLKEQSQVVVSKSPTLFKDLVQFNPEIQPLLEKLSQTTHQVITKCTVQ